MGNGNNIQCWKDPSVLNVGPLIQRIPSHANIVSNCLLNEMMTEDDSWNLDLFHVWLFEDIVRRTIGIPHHPIAGPNRISWLRTSMDSFSIKSVYWMLRERSLNPRDAT